MDNKVLTLDESSDVRAARDSSLSGDAEFQIAIVHDSDILMARQRGRQLAASLGFSSCDQTLVATAISEVARNILSYAKQGEIILWRSPIGGRPGLTIVARDEGPGIPDIKQAMQDGFSTSGSLGLGLAGSKRLVDEFNLESAPGKGTVITMKKWAVE